MQDIHSIGAGRIFSGGGGGGEGGRGGGGGGGDRRLRAQNFQNHQALKCPRCDSINTRFCYYNNYNLSQPRYFCKSCRRYWTKGGVLRNVPVGGGCRKAKRSKTKSSSEATTAVAVASAPSHPEQPNHDQRKENSHSSSDSSSLTAANSNVAVANHNTNNNDDDNNNNKNYNRSAGGIAEAVSAVTSHSKLINMSESKLFRNPNSVKLGPGLLQQGLDCGIFSEIGGFTSLFTSSNSETMPFGFGSVFNGQGLDQQWQQQHEDQKTMSIRVGGEEIGGGLVDQTVPVELSNLHSRSESGFEALDWQGSGDQGLFDLSNTVDQTYWSQSQWTDQDHPTLYLP